MATSTPISRLTPTTTDSGVDPLTMTFFRGVLGRSPRWGLRTSPRGTTVAGWPGHAGGAPGTLGQRSVPDMMKGVRSRWGGTATLSGDGPSDDDPTTC